MADADPDWRCGRGAPVKHLTINNEVVGYWLLVIGNGGTERLG